MYRVPWTGILTSFLTDRLSPEWMISVANNRHRVLRKPSSYPDEGNSFNSGNVTPSEFLKTVILIVQHRLLPPEGFRPEAKSRGGTLVTRAYIKDSTYSSNIQSVY